MMGEFYSKHMLNLYTSFFPFIQPALPTNYSLVSSVALTVLTFAAMQVFSDELAVEGRMTILGGFIGSWFFVFCLTVRGGL